MVNNIITVDNNTDDGVICYAPTMITTNGIWQGDNPLNFSLPLFILQLSLVVILTRVLFFLLKPFRQPRVVSEILGGIVLGPSVLGRSTTFADSIFPMRSVMVLETMGNVGLLYFLFLVGVEMDLSVIRRTGRKAMAIGAAGMVLPFMIGGCFSVLFHKTDYSMSTGTFILFVGVSLSVTAFPVLARVLAELKLINTELGRVAMASALFNDMCAWILLAIAIALTENQETSLASIWIILSSLGFVTFAILAVRPAIGWIIRRTPEGEPFSDFHICLVLTGVMVSGFITDAIGTHSIFGAFVFGLVIPNGPLGITLIEKLEDFVSGLLLPLFFAISGLKTNISAIKGPQTWGILLLLIFFAGAGKIAGTLVASLCYHMPCNEGISLGLLMNSKGLIEMIILNVGKDHKVLDDRSFATMVIVSLIMTALITPIVTVIYKPARRYTPYKKRTIQRSKPDSELRVLVCVHTPRNVPTIINLLEASNPTKRSPICIYVLHLVELTGRASAMLIVHSNHKSGRASHKSGRTSHNSQAQSDHIINAFENYEQHAGCVSVQPLTAISPYSTMHEDICSLAEDKRVAFVIIPFHKQQTVDGGMEAANPAFRTVNKNLLANAPCSVGILVDRGLSGSTRLAPTQVSHNVAVLFFGGHDDREALSYAWRMSEHPGVSLNVMRFVSGKDSHSISKPKEMKSDDQRPLPVVTGVERQKQLDDALLNDFRIKTVGKKSVVYTEKVANNGEETMASVRSMGNNHDLFIVGRGQGTVSPLTAGLTDWSECPELGAIGDLLAASDFSSTASVLVVQQYIGEGPHGDGVGTVDSPTGRVEEHMTDSWQMSVRPQPPARPHPVFSH